MWLNKSVLELAKLASKEESRYSLQGICVEAGCATFTDGSILVNVTNPSVGQDDASFPVIEGVIPRQVNGEEILIHRNAALAALKALPKRSNIPVLGMAMMAEGDKLQVTDLKSLQSFSHKLEGKFPNWRKVMPAADKTPAMVIGFDARRMKSLCEYFIANCDRQMPTVKLSVYDAESAMKMEGTTTDQQAITALFMPVRLK